MKRIARFPCTPIEDGCANWFWKPPRPSGGLTCHVCYSPPIHNTPTRQLLVAAAPKVVTRRGRCRRSLIEIRAFCQCYDAQLSLLGNNCGTFVDALLEFVLDGGEEEEAGRGWEREEQRGGGGDDDDDNDDLDDAASVLGWILGDDDD